MPLVHGKSQTPLCRSMGSRLEAASAQKAARVLRRDRSSAHLSRGVNNLVAVDPPAKSLSLFGTLEFQKKFKVSRSNPVAVKTTGQQGSRRHQLSVAKWGVKAARAHPGGMMFEPERKGIHEKS